MGEYIKGMRMPENCSECMSSDLRTTIKCTEWTEISAGRRENERAWSCPLVDLGKHGDLIDRDALEQEMLNGIKAGNLEEGYEMYANINTVDDCVECVRWADAVIEAEEEV